MNTLEKIQMDDKRVQDLLNRNFTNIWNEIQALKKLNSIELLSFDKDSITLRIGKSSRKVSTL